MRITVNTSVRACRRRAFTFMEVAISVAMVLFLFASYFTCVKWGLTTTRMQRENLRATQILINHMEGIRLFSWTQLTNSSLLPTNFTDYYYPGGSNNNQGTVYTGTVSVAAATLSPVAPNYSSSMYQITVKVQWTNQNNSFTRTMSTYQAMNGMQNYVF